MKVTKKLFLVALLLSLILSVGAVTAQDNMTFEKSNLQDISTETINQKEILSISNDVDQLADDETSSLGVINSHKNVEGSNFTSIQKSIDSANDGDTIYLGGKTYNGIGENIKVNKQLTIVGGTESNPNLIATLDAGKLSRIMNVSASYVVIKGIKFVNGNVEGVNGGAIYWTGNNGTISNSSFVNNHAFHAGAIYWNGVNEGYVSDCSFINNSALNDAGGLYAWESNLIVSNSLFENNSAGGGSGLYAFWCTINVFDSNFTNNYASRYGGALCNSLATFNVKNCSFENNRAGEMAGAIFNSGNMDIQDSYFKNNQGVDGGAIYHDRNKCIVSNSFFVENYAQYAGAIYSKGGIDINNNTFKDNGALNEASAILVDGPNNNITSNVIDNGNTNISAIYIANEDNLIIENNNFTNPQHNISYDEIIIEFDENYVGFVGKNISFPFYVHNTIGRPLSGEVSLQASLKSSDGLTIIRNLGKQTFVNGKASFDIKLPSSPDVMKMHAIFYLNSKIIQKSFDIIVSDATIASITQNNGSDDVVVKLLSDATGIVMFEAAGNNYFAEISNGDAIIDVTGLPNGRYAVNLIYSGDDNYQRMEKIIIIEVKNAASTVIDVNESFNGYAGKSIQIPVHVHDSLGNPLTGYVTLHGYATQELVGGKTTFSVSLPNAGSVLSLVVVYENEFKVINVMVGEEPVPPKPTLTQNKDVSIAYSGKASYKVLLMKDGKPIAGENVIISFNGKNSNVKTDANGYAALNLDANLKPGTYTVKATYDGVSVTNKVKITQIIKASDKKVKKSSKTTKVKISLMKVDGKYLKGKTLKVKFNGKTYNVKTDSKGVGTWKVKKSMLKKLKVNKKYKYAVSYGKDTLTKKLTIKK